MQHADEQTVLGDFGDRHFEFDGVRSTFTRRDGRFIVHTDGPDGRLADFEVKYTFGVEPLQQYLVELPGGRLQALNVAWDARPAEAGGQRWFRLYPEQQIDLRHRLHWTSREHNWNFMCADCHATGVTKGYDAGEDRYDTQFEELSVGCEACHGPGSAHVAWAARAVRSPDPGKGLMLRFDGRRGAKWSSEIDAGMPRRDPAANAGLEIEVCAQCHSRRAQLAEGHRPGMALLDHYLPSLLVPPLYYPDGQQREEVFIWGSWLQSRMHRAGVTCSDCHDPHSQRLQAEGNALCAQCHPADTYDAATHHHHEPDSAGAQCVDCHMPTKTYMELDPRRDHSMRVPRPDHTLTIGVPNACNHCHVERDATWAAQALRGWPGREPRGSGGFAEAFHAAEVGEPGAASALALIAADTAHAPLVRASALARMAEAGVRDVHSARRAAGDTDPLLRLAAVRLAEHLEPAEQRAVLAPLLTDALRAVRIEAARVLAGQHTELEPAQRDAWQSAAAEYQETLAHAADRPEAQVGLGTFLARTGRIDAANAAFARAITLDPEFAAAYLNAADAWRGWGDEDQALAMLERGLMHAPDSAALNHSLGLARIRLGRGEEALDALSKAVELAPEERRYVYVLAVAMNSNGRPTEALRVLERALDRWPYERDLLFALATMQRDAGHLEAARQTTERMVQAHPDDFAVRALQRQLR